MKAKRSVFVPLRLTHAEERVLNRLARELGLDRSAFLRHLVACEQRRRGYSATEAK